MIFTRPHLTIPFIYNARFTSTTLHWFVLAVVTGVLFVLAARDAIAVRHGAAIDPRKRAAHPRHRLPGRRYKMVAVMLSGLFAGLAGVLYAVQNEFAAPNFVYFLTSGETVIYNVMGGIGTLVGPIVGAGFFQLMRELLSRFFGDQFPYLIPLGIRLHRDHHLPAARHCSALRGAGSTASRHNHEVVLPRNAVSAATSFLSLSKSSAIRS